MKQVIKKRENLHTVEDEVKLILFALLKILAQSPGSRHKPLKLAGHHLPLRGCNKLGRIGRSPRFPLVSAAGSSHSVLVIAPFI